MNSFMQDMRASMRERAFWAYAVWLDMITRYRRMRLGVVWLLMPPVAYVVGLGFLYGHMMNKDPAVFLPHLGFGYILWRFAIQTISEASDIYNVHKAFIMDGRVRLTDYILRPFAKSLLYFVVGLLVVIVVCLFNPRVSWGDLGTLAISLPIFVLNIIWMASLVAAIGARFRDTREVINTCLIFGFLLTPILWDAALVPPDTVRGVVMRFNPFFHLIEFVRAPALGMIPEASTVVVVLAMTVGGWLVASLVYRRYSRYIPLWV